MGKMNMMDILWKNNKYKYKGLRLYGTVKDEFSGPFRILHGEELEVVSNTSVLLSCLQKWS
jgi:hypothetical protein